MMKHGEEVLKCFSDFLNFGLIYEKSILKDVFIKCKNYALKIINDDVIN